MTITGFEIGKRVRQTRALSWGIGEILDNSDMRYLRVIFEDNVERTVQRMGIAPVEGEEAISPALDNLLELRTAAAAKRGGRKAQNRQPRYNISDLREKFLGYFPQGFQDPEYLAQERNTKAQASGMVHELLGKDVMASLIQKEKFNTIASAAKRVAAVTNLIPKSEHMRFSTALKGIENRKAFSLALQELLFGTEPLESRFDAFLECLERIGAFYWSIATYFLFLHDPASQMFMKPIHAREVASACSFPLNYHAKPSGAAYTSFLEFAQKMQLDFLSEMGPQDFIDVQSFISASYMIAEGKYGKQPGASKKAAVVPVLPVEIQPEITKS